MDTKIYNLIESRAKELYDFYGRNEVTVRYEAVNQFTDTTKAEIWMTNYPNRLSHAVLCHFLPTLTSANIIYDIVAKDNRVFIEICF